MSALARAYVLWRRWSHRAAAAGDAVATGLWLGVMGRGALHAVDQAFYEASGPYREEEHNTRGLFPWEEEAVRGHFAGCRALLVVGAGGGREVLALAERGFAVEGYECNAALAGYAAALLARRGSAGVVRLLPRDEAPAGGGPYDGIVVGWSAYMLIAGRARRVAFLRGLRRRVPLGAPVLLSFWTRPGDSARTRIVAAVGGALRRLLRREPLESGDDLAPNFVHRFTAAEVAAELREGGFRAVRFEPEGRGPTDSGWAVGVAEGEPGEGPGVLDSPPRAG